MKLSVFVLILSLSGCANTSVPEIKALEGDWVSTNFIEDVQRTKSPHLAWFRESPALSFTISAAENGSGYELIRTNFHEGLSSRILRLERIEKTKLFGLIVEAPNLRNGIDLVQLRFDHDKSGHITTLSAANLWDREREQEYVRLPVTLAQYLNRIILAGSYRDLSGAEYSFSEAGEARWPDQSFQYEIVLDPSEAGCEYIQHPDRNGVGGRKRYGYRWSDKDLELFNINYVNTEKCTICCDSQPFATLHQSN